MSRDTGVTKIAAASPKSFGDAVRGGIERAAKTLRGITRFHVIEQKAMFADGKVSRHLATIASSL